MPRITKTQLRYIFVGIALVAIVLIPLHVGAQEDLVVTPSGLTGCAGLLEFFTKPFTCIVGYVSYGLNYLIGFILGVFLSLATYILSFAISFSGGVLDPAQNQVVFVGWGI